MNIAALNCPNCGAPLSVPNGKAKFYCENCGTPIMIDDGQIYVNINVTKSTTNHSVEEHHDYAAESREETKQMAINAKLLVFVLILAVIIWFFALRSTS